MDHENKPISPLWLLADRLSVVEAALLLIDIEPQGASDDVERWIDKEKPHGYVAARRAILSAILKNRVQGSIRRVFEEDMRGNVQETERIDYPESWVETESLRDWLADRGFRSVFFSIGQENTAPEYLDRSHPRYAPKLAAAVEAWERVEQTDFGSGTAKQRLSRWLRLNAAKFGLVDDDGKPTESVIEEIAKVANWARGGGAPRQKKESGPDFDDEIPF
jgi:hypothetical protein